MSASDAPRSLAVGVTGGIGSGKSHACRTLAACGAAFLSADLVARELLDTDEQLKRAVRKLFGDEVYTAAGALDRKRVARRVFQEPALKRSLEELVHPATLARIDKEIDRAGRPVVVVEAALIFEAKAERMFDYIVVVDAPEESRITRVMARDAVSRHEVLERIAAQLPVEEKLRRADFVLKNTGDLELFDRNTRFLYTILLSMASMPHVDDESQE